MPEKDQNKDNQQLMAALLDVMIQGVALEIALVEAGLLKSSRVREIGVRLNQLDGIRDVREASGVQSSMFRSLLEAFEGPPQ